MARTYFFFCFILHVHRTHTLYLSRHPFSYSFRQSFLRRVVQLLVWCSSPLCPRHPHFFWLLNQGGFWPNFFVPSSVNHSLHAFNLHQRKASNKRHVYQRLEQPLFYCTVPRLAVAAILSACPAFSLLSFSQPVKPVQGQFPSSPPHLSPFSAAHQLSSSIRSRRYGFIASSHQHLSPPPHRPLLRPAYLSNLPGQTFLHL